MATVHVLAHVGLLSETYITVLGTSNFSKSCVDVIYFVIINLNLNRLLVTCIRDSYYNI